MDDRSANLPTTHPPEHDPFKDDGDQSDEAIALIEAGIEASKAKHEPYLIVHAPDEPPDGRWMRVGRFLNTKYFWDLQIDIETRRKIIADYTKAAAEYDAPEADLLAPDEEPEVAETTPVTLVEAPLPRISLPPAPPAPPAPDPKPYEGVDWGKRASHDYDDPDE